MDMEITLLTMNTDDLTEIVVGFEWFSMLSPDDKLTFINSITVEQAGMILNSIEYMTLMLVAFGSSYFDLTLQQLDEVNAYILQRAIREVFSS